MSKEIKSIDGDLLKAILMGGKIIISRSRSNDAKTIVCHVVILEMPKDIIAEDFQTGEEPKYWKHLVFLHTPDVGGWWHASSNNLTKKKNVTKAWNEWSEFKHYTKDK